MSFPEVKDIIVYWKRYPPLVELVSAYMGIEQPKEKKSKPNEIISEDELMRRMRADLAMLGQ